MVSEIRAVIAALGSIAACVLLLLVLRRAHEPKRLRLLAEQALAGQRAEAETTRAHLASAERALGGRLEAMRTDTQAALNALTLASTREQGESRVLLATTAALQSRAQPNGERLGLPPAKTPRVPHPTRGAPPKLRAPAQYGPCGPMQQTHRQ